MNKQFKNFKSLLKYNKINVKALKYLKEKAK
jgi:hypothetical protein